MQEELSLLWEGASTGQKQAGLETLLGTIPQCNNLPSRVPPIAAACDASVNMSQQVLQCLHVHPQLLGDPERQAQLQCLQITAEVY